MKIVVFGSINMDLTAYVPKLPLPGETLFGDSYITVPGGKGNNQAVAAARLGADVQFVGRVGDDIFGQQVLKIVAAENVNVSQVAVDKEKRTGLAVISVDKNAENAITVISGANWRMGEEDVARAEGCLSDADVLMLQIEVPLQASLQIAEIAKRKNVKVIFDPAPATPLPDKVYQTVDFITPNETETEILVGILPHNKEEARQAAAILHQRGVNNVIIKMGARGVYYDNVDQKGFVQPYTVKAIDSVAAGDAFNAGLAVAIAEGKPIAEAVKWGAAAGAIATTRKGALPAMPYRAELEKLMREQG
ncbi:MAG TPA: ribokinase [Anaerolineaceae bacterium]|nr:ribokinase [Anaerolineaceae bacterium]